MTEIQNLLDAVFTITEKDRKSIEQSIERGELFNIFSILNLRTNEVRTHSAFLAELLSPNGSHACGDKLLALFLKSLEPFKGFQFNTKKAIVTVEESIGDINSDQTQGGRIDIIIKSGQKVIVIENKIYAEDQTNQLVRYHNYCNCYSDSRLLYLTLEGYYPSEESSRGLEEGKNYYNISYSDDILEWLKQCEKATKNKPLVFNSIVQYRNLIKELTNQMSSDENEEEIINLLCNKENRIKTAAILDRSNIIAERITEECFWNPLITWAKRQGLEFSDELGFDFSVRPKNWENHWIILKKQRVNSYLQIQRVSGRVHKQLQLESLSGSSNKDWPFGYEWLVDMFNDLHDIVNGEAKEKIKKIVKDILKELEDRKSEIEGLNIIL